MNGRNFKMNTAQKFLTFLLAGELYAINLKDIQEIKGSKEKIELTKLLNAPPHIRGLLELHQQIIPIIDLRILYDLDSSTSEFDVLLIIHFNSKPIGLSVDNVLDIVELDKKDLKPPPDFFSVIERNYINEIGTHHEHLIMILNIEKLLTDKKLAINDHLYQRE